MHRAFTPDQHFPPDELPEPQFPRQSAFRSTRDPQVQNEPSFHPVQNSALNSFLNRPTGQVLVENENRVVHPSQAPARNPFLNRPFPVRPSPPENSCSVPYQKLPKFDEIPLFSGDLTAFKPFWDYFEPRIHLVPAPAYEKMIRLQHALKGGSAAYIVENRARTLEDYESVITILTTRYLDQSKIEDFLEFELLAISPPIHDDSRSLLEFADKIDTFKSRFRHNRSEIPRNVVKKLFYKLDTETRRHATLRSSVKGYDLNNVDDFLKFLYELAAETEKWFFAPGKENVKPQTRSNPVVTPKNHFRIHGSVDTPSGCPFCSENHKASDCSKVKSYDARMQSLKVQRKCFRCFDPNHLSSAFPAPAYEKMIRLQHALKGGSAAYIVENRARTLEDYESVITILTTRYLDQSKIEDFLEFELLAISPPIHDDSRSLLEFADKIDTFKSRFRHNRSEIPRNVVKKLFYKLDTETRRHATLRSSVKGYDLNNVDDFLKFLYELAAETEKWFFAPGKENVKPQTRSNPVVTPKNHFRIHGSVDTPSGCPFCSENHKASDCSKVKSYDARMQSLKVQRKCFRCFDPNHLSSACERKFSCEKCGKNHQTFVCPPRSDLPVISPSNSVPVGDSESNALCFTIISSESKNEPPPVFPSQVGTKFCMISVNCQCSESVPPNPVNLFVDCGSDINFMKKSAVISDIPLVFDRNLIVSSFHGSIRVKSCRLNVVFSPNENQRFNFVPDVSHNPVGFTVHVVDDTLFERLKGSRFSRDVDVILGVDAMMALQFSVTEYRSDAGYQIVKTCLGYFEAGSRRPFTQLHPTNIVPPPLGSVVSKEQFSAPDVSVIPDAVPVSPALVSRQVHPPRCMLSSPCQDLKRRILVNGHMIDYGPKFPFKFTGDDPPTMAPGVSRLRVRICIFPRNDRQNGIKGREIANYGRINLCFVCIARLVVSNKIYFYLSIVCLRSYRLESISGRVKRALNHDSYSSCDMATTTRNLSSSPQLASRLVDLSVSDSRSVSPTMSPVVRNSTQIGRNITTRLNQLIRDFPSLVSILESISALETPRDDFVDPNIADYSDFPRDLEYFQDRIDIIDQALIKWDNIIEELSSFDIEASVLEEGVKSKYFEDHQLDSNLGKFRHLCRSGLLHSRRLKLVIPEQRFSSLTTCISPTSRRQSPVMHRAFTPDQHFPPDELPEPQFPRQSAFRSTRDPQVQNEPSFHPVQNSALNSFLNRPTGQVLVENENRVVHPSQAPARNPFLNRPFPVRPSPPENSCSVPYQKLPKFDEIPLFSVVKMQEEDPLFGLAAPPEMGLGFQEKIGAEAAIDEKLAV
uniref:Integrase catalytic domain-containing protein n=2 Tax=Bursaphelenchus xylophilus TaxID=6326 RepID=A0A1I7RWN2_BURXY